jgi:hypothetical protein
MIAEEVDGYVGDVSSFGEEEEGGISSSSSSSSSSSPSSLAIAFPMMAISTSRKKRKRHKEKEPASSSSSPIHPDISFALTAHMTSSAFDENGNSSNRSQTPPSQLSSIPQSCSNKPTALPVEVLSRILIDYFTSIRPPKEPQQPQNSCSSDMNLLETVERLEQEQQQCRLQPALEQLHQAMEQALASSTLTTTTTTSKLEEPSVPETNVIRLSSQHLFLEDALSLTPSPRYVTFPPTYPNDEKRQYIVSVSFFSLELFSYSLFLLKIALGGQ